MELSSVKEQSTNWVFDSFLQKRSHDVCYILKKNYHVYDPFSANFIVLYLGAVEVLLRATVFLVRSSLLQRFPVSVLIANVMISISGME